MTKLFRFEWDCKRMGVVQGIFAADEEAVQKAIGKDIYFGEILGKHSEISGTLEAKDIKVLTDDQSFIAKAIEYGLVPSGHNPLDYIQE